MENAKVSSNFTVSEFMSDVAKKDQNGDFVKDAQSHVISAGKDRFMRLNSQLLEQLEVIRAENGNKPIYITEGYRTIEWHKALKAGGYETAGYSPHTAGIAADFGISGISPADIQGQILGRITSGAGTGRVGRGLYFTHYDLADTVYGPLWKDPKTGFKPGGIYNTGYNWGYNKN